MTSAMPAWMHRDWIPDLQVVSAPLLVGLRATHLELLERRSSSPAAAEDLRRFVERIRHALQAQWADIEGTLSEAKLRADRRPELKVALERDTESLAVFVRHVLGNPDAEVEAERSRELGWSGRSR